MKVLKANVQRSHLKQWDFVGIGKRNKDKTYREYAETIEDAILGVCTGHRVSPKDIKLVQ